MEDRNLQELCYRVIQELRRYRNGEEVESFEGRLERETYSWRFRSIGGYYSHTVVEMRMSMDELYGRFRVNLPQIVERMEVYWDRRERLPSIRLYDRYGQPVHIPDRTNYRQQLSAMTFNQEYMMEPPRIDISEERNHMQDAMMYGMSVLKAGGVYKMGADFAQEPPKPKEKSRKELLAESRPTRLARLWKDMYAKTGKKPLSIKQLATT